MSQESSINNNLYTHSLDNISSFLSNRLFEIFICFIIIINIFSLIILSEPHLHYKFKTFMTHFETFSIMLFSVEYILRVLCLKNFKDLFKPLLIIDLLAILPFYLSFLCCNLVFLRIFRLIRIFRIFKLARYSRALQNIGKAFIYKKEELTMAAIILFIAVIASSSLMYTVEGHIQKSFSTIPKAMWWSVMTFTTVGYGDVYPITSTGKFIASLLAIFGIVIHGLLASILISGFIELNNNN